MEYCYSGTERLWYGSWNRHVCRKGKCAADRHSRSTGVNPSRKQRCCSPSCLWSQAQRNTFDPDNSQSLGYWLTIRHRCICVWSWTEMLIIQEIPGTDSKEQNRSTEGCPKFKRFADIHVQERIFSNGPRPGILIYHKYVVVQPGYSHNVS